MTEAALQIISDRPQIMGVVERGRRLGRTLGFPTANVPVPPAIVVPHGVYAVRSRLSDGRVFDGVASLGCNPTVPKDKPVLEVWLFDFDEEIYDQEVATELVAFLRDELAFDSLADLTAQVFRDADAARCVLRPIGAPLRDAAAQQVALAGS